jgi:hypothetical protein
MTIAPDARSVLDHRLNEVAASLVCVQAWLGYGDVTFIGFGTTILELTPSGDHPMPAYEFQTQFGRWWLCTPSWEMEANVTDPDEIRERIALLVGRRLERWRFGASPAVVMLRFEGGIDLHLGACDGVDAEESDAWLFCCPDSRWIQVACSGLVRFEHEEGDEAWVRTA